MTTTGGYTRFSVDVPGGALCVGRWGDGPDVVVASHGITANHLSWQRAGELLVDRTSGAMSLVAVDHRGRAGSSAVSGPYGLSAHAHDLLAVLDEVGATSATFAGHSMGAFVVAVTAEIAPDRVARLLLVDGGLPLPIDVPPDADVEEVVRSVIGPALDRLDRRWPDEESYVDFFRAHPAFQAPNEWWPSVEAYVRHDATVTPSGDIASSVLKDAVLVDGGAAITDPAGSSAIERTSVPAQLLWAPRGVLDTEPGLYRPADIRSAVERLPHLRADLVPDTNHYTIACSDQGAVAIVEALVSR